MVSVLQRPAPVAKAERRLFPTVDSRCVNSKVLELLLSTLGFGMVVGETMLPEMVLSYIYLADTMPCIFPRAIGLA